ncbi:MAG: ComF family protein [Dehalococcoidales bacterium]|nr:ComF family protein [Dehalococcoidales bacterium]
MLPQVKKLGELALNILFPQRCIACGKEGSFICSTCSYNIPLVTPPVCPLCGRPHSSGLLCPSCITWNSEIDGIRSPFRFDGVIRQSVYQLKYRNLRAIAPFLAQYMYDCLQRNAIPGDVLVPVPLHKQRYRERGYNQSNLLAKETGKLSGLPVVTDVLVKHRNTAPQARTSSVSERQKNISNAFSCTEESLSGRNVILIDDVATSGATLDACAAVLKEAGVSSVWGLTLAREI